MSQDVDYERSSAWTTGRFSAELANVRWQNTVMRMRIKDALEELGDPTPDYPAPVANAVAILRRALHNDGSESG